MKGFIQYELWKDCTNGCKFCFNKGQKDIDKIESMNFVINKLDDEELNDYEEVGLIGGEFFDRQLDDLKVKEVFYQLIDKCIEKIQSRKIEKLYIATALIFDIDRHLIPFLNYLKDNNVLENILLCTSYDLKYRFYTEKRKKLWEDNMILLHQLYPSLKLHTETIVSGFFVDAVLNNEFDIKQFCEKFNTHIDYIEPSSGFYYKNKKECMGDIEDFYPTKDKFIKFLHKTILADKVINIETFLSPYIRSDKVYYNYNGKRCVIEDRRANNMVIQSNDLDVEYEYGFADSNDKMIDIVNNLRQMIMD